MTHWRDKQFLQISGITEIGIYLCVCVCVCVCVYTSSDNIYKIYIYSDKYIYIYISHFFIQSSVNGHLGCFRDLVTVNSNAVNVGEHVSFQSRVSSRYMPKLALLNHMVTPDF